MSRRAVAVGTAVVVALLLAGAGLVRILRAPSGDQPESAVAANAAFDSAALAPAGVRVRVRVLNSTNRSGLARRATQRLRDHGYDVVDFGNQTTQVATTSIETSPGMRAIGERVVLALGAGAVTEAAAALPYADVLVVLGPDWQPPPQPLRP